MTRTLLVLLAVLLVPVASADAHHLPVPLEWKIQHSLPIAEAAWPGSPCAGRLTVRSDAETNAALVARGARGQYPGGCVLDVQSTLDPVTFCIAVVHEAGHAAGLPHNDDPGDVMYGAGAQRFDPCGVVAPPVHLRALERDITAKRVGHTWSCRGSSSLRRCLGRPRRLGGLAGEIVLKRLRDGDVEVSIWYFASHGPSGARPRGRR